MIVTKSIVQAAIKACKDANIPVDPTLASLKAEAIEEEEDDILEQTPLANETVVPDSNPTSSQVSKWAKGGSKAINVGVSEYIATEDCWTSVLDQERRHKKPNKRNYDAFQYGELKAHFMKALKAWRIKKFEVVSELYDTTPESIMTDKELESIAKTKAIIDPTAFDNQEVQWPGHWEWRVEVLKVLAGLQKEEDTRIAMLEKRKKEQEEVKQKIQAGKEAKLEKKRMEKATQGQQWAEDQARKEAERASRLEEKSQRAAACEAQKDKNAAENAAAIQRMEMVSGGHFSSFYLTPIQPTTQLTPISTAGTNHAPPALHPSQLTPDSSISMSTLNISDQHVD